MLSPFKELRHQNREWRAAGVSTLVSARTRRHAGREQGLKTLAREVTQNAVQFAPTSQADWLWDCTTPQAALAGTSVSVSAICFLRKIAATGTFFVQIASVDRMSERGSWPSGREGVSPQRLKPCAVSSAFGTPEGVPLQNSNRVNGTLGVPLQNVPKVLFMCDGAHPVHTQPHQAQKRRLSGPPETHHGLPRSSATLAGND